MKKIIFKGLLPNDNVVHDKKILKNGATAQMEDAEADAYISLKLAFELTDENEATKFQEQQKRVNKTRNKIKAKDEVK